MKTIFFGDDGRIRSGWRALIFLITFGLLAFAAILASTILLSQIPFGESAAGYLPLLVPFSLSAVVAIVLGWFFGKLFEQLPYSALGLSFSSRSALDLVFGFVIGGIALASAVLIAVMGGGMSLAINHDSAASAVATSLWTTFVIFAIGALSEESLFRGYLLQTFVRSRVSVVGVVFTSMLFSAAHNANPSANWVSAFNTLLAGFWFAVAYLKFRNIWFPLGIHLMWNWLQGPVFGINVSGLSEFSPDPIMRATDKGPAILTGGNYGIEGGIACTIAIAISIGIVYFLPDRGATVTQPVS
jgi:membrane protease YdiL (CAAX protease family)